MSLTSRFTMICAAVAMALAAACGSAHPAAPTPVVVTPPTSPAPPPPPAPVLGITRILAFGDSMTEGVTSPGTLHALTAGIPQSYPFKLQALASARYADQAVAVLNAGRAGEIVTDPLTRTRFNDALSEAKPELVLLMEGANDLNGVNLSVNLTVDIMEELIRDAQKRGAFVMLATLPPQRQGTGSKTTTPDTLERYNSKLRAIAIKRDAQLIDMNTLLPVSFIGQDGLHPTEAGYQRIAEIFLDAIKARYEKAPAALLR